MSALNILTIAFVVLKLVGVITWSWGIILLPTIIWLVFRTVLLLCVAAIAYFSD